MKKCIYRINLKKIGTLIKKLNEPRSYIFKDKNNRLLRRNTIFIKKKQGKSSKGDIDNEGDQIKLINMRAIENYKKITEEVNTNEHKKKLGRKVVKPNKFNL